MNRRFWMVVAGVGLTLLLWFMLEPGKFLSPPASVSDDLRFHREEFNTSPSFPIVSQAKYSTGKEGAVEVDVGLVTGSGKEVPGEKIVRFGSLGEYQKFLTLAPRGSVLGQVDALKAVRVKTGGWLKGAVAQTGGTMSSNFYIHVPEVPLEVRQKGDALYEAVGKKALDLVGAEGVTPGWGRGIKIALMDTPVDGMDKVEGESAGHGTAMRSLIVGQTGSARGASPGAVLVPFPVLDEGGKGNAFGLAEAILRATDQGFRVINMSLGSDGDSPVVRDAVAYALARNVVLVAAAGNDAVNRVSYPAAYDGVVAVASVDATGNHLYFSNRGASVDVAAPGFFVAADWPGGKNVEVSGTSASTALVTGAVAALLSKEPGLTGAQAARLLVSYADDTGMPGRDDETGGGMINLRRILERNQRGIVDLAVAGVTMKEEGNVGRITVGIQNRGTETVNSPVQEILVGRETRKFYLRSLEPGQSAGESVTFDLLRARQEGGVSAGAAVNVRGDQRSGNDIWNGHFRISKEK